MQVFDYFLNFHLHFLRCYNFSYLCTMVGVLSLKHQKLTRLCGISKLVLDCDASLMVPAGIHMLSCARIMLPSRSEWFKNSINCFICCYKTSLKYSQLGKHKEESTYKTRYIKFRTLKENIFFKRLSCKSTRGHQNSMMLSIRSQKSIEMF